MDKIDRKTLELIDERFGIMNVFGKFITYIQESNKELVEMKKAVQELTGKDLTPRTPEQLKKLREGGDILRNIQKLIELNQKMKVK